MLKFLVEITYLNLKRKVSKPTVARKENDIMITKNFTLQGTFSELFVFKNRKLDYKIM